MARTCCWPSWADDERPTFAFCAEPVVSGARWPYCWAHQQLARRQPGEPVHVHDPRRGQGWGGALLAGQQPRLPNPVPDAPKLQAQKPAKVRVAATATPKVPKPPTWSRASVTLDENEIRAMRQQGASIVEIANAKGCGRSTVMRLLRRLGAPTGAEFVAARHAA